MPTITAGNSATFALQPDQTITLTTVPGTEGSMLLNGAQAPTLGNFGPPALINKVYGPGVAGTVSLTAKSGAVTYALSATAFLTSDQMAAVQAAGSITYGDVLAARTVKSDTLPPQQKNVSATGAVTQAPVTLNKITCTAGTAVTLVLRDSVQQNLTDTDTTSLQIQSLTMNAGDVVYGPFEFAFGVHATVGGTSPAYTLEF